MTDLLTMIRTVDPNDKAACDELNARFWCWLYDFTFIGLHEEKYPHLGFIAKQNRDDLIVKGIPKIRYTHSLDALKAIQYEHLKGWNLIGIKWSMENNAFYVIFQKTISPKKLGENTKYIKVKSNLLPTMNRAWMDAIYQAIEWKRRQNDD